ncbi:PREDICTED: limbic system-associated membrane protein [Drosophila arizonae]|uniref:Limbic system-associated membrane protein n=1 Tax=Drosophila arizonae TaxID=7263 RepID=A0ABM1NP82_DROAR|nr:PREDICTED: limbic system-associated membrane protein [Drosophila arizonae]
MLIKYIKRRAPANAWAHTINTLVLLSLLCQICDTQRVDVPAEVIVDPKFSYPIANVTAPVGRDAFLTCVVQDLGPYKVAWLRVDTQTILTIQNHVITKNQRIGIANSEHKTWTMRIRDIKESDRGWYMCQINTDPMKSQMGYLDVVVPPDILDYPTSTDMVVREGSNVTLKCAATGSPEPTITWRRESGVPIELANGEEVASIEGTDLIIPQVKRQHMGAYLCIASNGVPPSVSKRITLVVHFPPMISVQNQLIGAVEGKGVTLECQSEAYPKSINYWTRERGEIVPPEPNGMMNENGNVVITQQSLPQVYKFYKYALSTDTFESRHKNELKRNSNISLPPSPTIKKLGKKRTKSSEMYHSSRAQEHSGEDTENPGKRKADLSLSAEGIDNMYGASAAVSQHPRHTGQTLSWLCPAMLLLMRLMWRQALTLTRQLRKTQLALLPQTLTHV